MKYFLICILFLFSFSGLFSQNKYYIYFSDKGEAYPESFNKVAIENSLSDTYSKKSIERRKAIGNIIFTYEDYPVNENYLNIVKSFGVRIENILRWFNACTAYLNETQIKRLLQLPFISSVQRVKIFKSDKKNYQPDFSALPKGSAIKDNLNYGLSFNQLNFSKIVDVHKFGITGQNVIIGILDTGFRWRSHQALLNSIVIKEYDFIYKDTLTNNKPTDWESQDAHGTYVMSVVGGKSDGNLYGAAYDAKFLLAKTEDIRSESKVEEDNFAAALEWMEKLGVDIVTSSLGYNEFDDPNQNYTYKDLDGKTTITAKAMNIIFQKGVVCFNTAGNEGANNWKYVTTPADAFNVLAVGALNNNGSLASFSSRGPTYDGRIKPDICAQGVDVYGASTVAFDYYIYQNGTSCSTPIAAGVSALLLSQYNELTNIQVKDVFRQTSDRALKPDTLFGWGAINAVDILSFPFIVERGQKFVLLKTFLSDNLNTNSVKLYYSIDGTNFKFYPLVYTGSKNKFEIIFNDSIPRYDKIKFYFSYSDSSGKSFRLPVTDSLCYSFVIADKKVFNYEKTNNQDFPFKFSQNYPNPFYYSIEGITRFDIELPSEQNINISIYDIIGRKIKNLVENSNFSKGEHTIVWNGTDNFNKIVPTGVYLLKLKSDNYFQTKKIVFIK